MATAQEIEDNLENVSVFSDCFEEDDELWNDINNENRPPLNHQAHSDGVKRMTTMAPSLEPIHEESRLSSGSKSSNYVHKNYKDDDECTEVIQAQTPMNLNSVLEQSIVYNDEPFVPMSNLSEKLRQEEVSLQHKNRFLVSDHERRSWEGKSHDSIAMGSLLCSKTGQLSENNTHSGQSLQNKSHCVSKIFTSTPKGQSRSHHTSFEDCPVSTIECKSPHVSKNVSLNSMFSHDEPESHTGSTLSNTKIGDVIKNINLADDSIDAATRLMSNTHLRSRDTKFGRSKETNKTNLSIMSGFQIYQATGMVPKISYRKKETTIDPRLEKINQTLEIIEKRSCQKDGLKMSTSPKSSIRGFKDTSRSDKTYTVERPMNIRDRTSPADPSAILAVKPFPLSHFGFVAVNDSIILTVTVTNISKDMIQVQGDLKEGVFTLLEKSPVIINPNEQFNFAIKFVPDQRARYKANLLLKIQSSDITIIHGLLGFGGAANLKVFTNKALQMYPTLSYVLFPPSPLSFSFDVANDGERAGFVVIQSVDDDNNVIHGVTVTPDRFLMLTNENAKSYKEKWEQTITVTIRPNTLRSLIDRARVSNGGLVNLSRVSGNSERSSINNGGHLFNLKLVWGDERFRQRAKKYIAQSHCSHPIVHGIPITKLTFLDNEESTMQRNTDGFLTEQDINIFQAQICVTTVRVGDQRAVQDVVERLSSRPSSAASNRSVPEGFYIPRQFNDGLNASRISIAPSTDRTVMPSKTKRH